MYDRHEWTPANYPEEERDALQEALEIRRRQRVIELTGWSEETYWATSREFTWEVLVYRGAVAEAIAERSQRR